MTHKVKICAGCGDLNSPDEALCRKCQLMLPAAITVSDEPPPSDPAHLDTPPEPRHGHQELPEKLDRAARRKPREWPYAAVPIVPPTHSLRVTVVDFDISFTHLVMLMVKAVLAALPALLLLIVIVSVMAIILGLVFSPFKP